MFLFSSVILEIKDMVVVIVKLLVIRNRWLWFMDVIGLLCGLLFCWMCLGIDVKFVNVIWFYWVWW